LDVFDSASLRECNPTDTDFRLLLDGGFEIDIRSVVVSHLLRRFRSRHHRT
jgi:hypothetical protein